MKYLYQFSCAFLLSLVFTPIVRYISIKTGRIAEVKGDRWHSEPKALMGGCAIWLALLLSALPLLIDNHTALMIISGASSMFLLGLIDDIWKLPPQFKLIGQIIIAATLVHFGLVIEIIPYPAIAVPLTIFWIIGITNSFNLLDNMDGLSAGIASISAMAMGILLVKNGNADAAVLSLILAGASLGFLKYNFNPATIFMGDCGSMLLGFLLSSITILGTWIHASNLITTMAAPLLVLSIPIFDTTFVTLTRKFSGRPISQGGTDHVSHRLVYLGLTEKRAVLILYAFSGLFAALSIYYHNVNPLWLAMISILVAIGLYCMGLSLGETDQRGEGEILKTNKRNIGILSKRRVAEILIDILLISSAYFASYQLRYEGIISSHDMRLFVASLPWIIIIKLIIFSYMGLYRSIWKYVGIHDALDIIKATILSSFVIITIILMSPARFKGYSRAVFIIDSVLTITFIGGTRFIILLFREFIANWRTRGKRILIVGAGDAGATVLREIKNNTSLNFRVIGFVDDDPQKIKTQIHGIPVLGDTESLNNIATENGVGEVIIAMPSAKRETIYKVTKHCRQANLNYGTFPIVKKLLERMHYSRRGYQPGTH